MKQRYWLEPAFRSNVFSFPKIKGIATDTPKSYRDWIHNKWPSLRLYGIYECGTETNTATAIHKLIIIRYDANLVSYCSSDTIIVNFAIIRRTCMRTHSRIRFFFIHF